jgi:hypothetical protein
MLNCASLRPAARWLRSAACFLLFLPGTTLASFVVSPMEHHLQTAPGARETAVVAIRNNGRRAISLKLYFADSRFHSDGREEDLPVGTADRSCAPWILLEQPFLDLDPGQVKQVTLRVSVPEDAGGSYWTKLYLEETSTPEPMTSSNAGRTYQVYMKQRMGVRVFEDVAGTGHSDALVSKVSVRPGTRERVFAARVENSGNALLRCQGRIEIRDKNGAALETLKLGSNGEFLLFPGSPRDLTVPSHTPLGAGTYTALAIVDFGGEHLVAGEEVFNVKAGDAWPDRADQSK